MPKVSILIPTYNYARFLPEALDSILIQTYQDYEVIISDDASTDNTQEIVAPYLGKDSRIKYVRHENNLGMVQNWNWTLKQARGEYVQFLFADDKLYHLHVLSKFVCALDENSSASMAVCARYVINEDLKIVGFMGELGVSGLQQGLSVIRRCLHKGHNLVGEPSVVMFRNELAGRGFDEKYCQLVDLEMWLYLCRDGDVYYFSDPMCCFRRHPGQQTEVNKREKHGLQEGFSIFDKYVNFLMEDAPCNFIAKCQMYNVLFAQRRRISKSAERESNDFGGCFSRFEMPLSWIFMCFLWYKISRPLYNLTRSIRKRKRIILERIK